MRYTKKCRYKYSNKEDTINPILYPIRNLSRVSTVSTIDCDESTGYKIQRYPDVEGERAGCREEEK